MKIAAILSVSALAGSANAFHVANRETAFARKSTMNALPEVVSLPVVAKAASTTTVSALPAAAAAAVSIGGVPAVALAGGVALVAAVAAYAVSQSKKDDAGAGPAKEEEPEPEPIDVSIPYDAAARLAYCASKGTKEVTDEEDFKKFNKLYLEATSAEIGAKKKAKELADFMGA